MMSKKDGARKVIEAFSTIFTFIMLFGGFFIIKTFSDNPMGLTKRARSSFWPAQLSNRIITLVIINQIFYVYLHLSSSAHVFSKFREVLYHIRTLKHNMNQRTNANKYIFPG
ncbi:hypothetical protein [Desulfocicer niacini]